ncbi:hypothetical protein [Mycetocola saprophilus]|uniref:hypothetical protein n=1 Tax=Mycetocola saprophilus TaxID=76636 RepID=UPI0004C0D227|nr:hypothetical protein [Mycetocola saprophilus]
MSSKPRTREFFPKMKQRGRYRAYRAPRTNLFPGLEQFRLVMVQGQLAARVASAALAAFRRGIERNQLQHERARIYARATAQATSLPSSEPQMPYAGSVRGAVPNLVLIDEIHLLRDDAEEGSDVFPLSLTDPNDAEPAAALAEVAESRVSWWRRVFGGGRR